MRKSDLWTTFPNRRSPYRLGRGGPGNATSRGLSLSAGSRRYVVASTSPFVWVHPSMDADELGAAQVALLLSCFTQSRLKAFFNLVPARFLRLGTLFDRRAILFDLGTVASWERLAVLR